MSFAALIAILAGTLFALSQVQRRTDRFGLGLIWLNRALAVAVLGLTAYYFIDRFTA